MTTEEEKNETTAEGADAEVEAPAAEPAAPEAAASGASDDLDEAPAVADAGDEDDVATDEYIAAPERGAADVPPDEETIAAEMGAKATIPDKAKDDTVAEAGALFIGVSRRKDEYGTPGSDRLHMTDEELLAMGVEPDLGPNDTLIATFAGLTFAVGLTAVATAMFFLYVEGNIESQMAEGVHPVLAEVRAEATLVLDAYAAVEGEDGETTGYRVPLDKGIEILLDNPVLLARHPMGETHDAPDPMRLQRVEPDGTVGGADGAGEGVGVELQDAAGDPNAEAGAPAPDHGDAPTAGAAHDQPGHEGHGH